MFRFTLCDKNAFVSVNTARHYQTELQFFDGIQFVDEKRKPVSAAGKQNRYRTIDKKLIPSIIILDLAITSLSTGYAL